MSETPVIEIVPNQDSSLRFDFRVNISPAEKTDGALFESAGDLGEEARESLPYQMAQSLRSLREILTQSAADFEPTSEPKNLLVDLHVLRDEFKTTPSGFVGSFYVNGWLIVQGNIGYHISRALDKNSVDVRELSGQYSVLGCQLSQEADLEELRECFHIAGVVQAPSVAKLLSPESASVAKVRERATLARRMGMRVKDVYPSGRSLREHQVEAVLSLAYTQGGLLADQVGLGKGGEFTCAWETTKDYLMGECGVRKEDIGPCVVSVTKSMVGEIAHEITLWADSPKVVVLKGRSAHDIPHDVDYVVLNHDILKAQLDTLKSLKPDAFIADEAHVFKTPSAQRSEAAVALSEDIRRRNPDAFICMATGTPFLNRPSELWGLLKVLGRDGAVGGYALDKVSKKTVYWRRDRRTGRMVSQQARTTPLRAFEIFFCGGHYDRFNTWWNSGATHTSALNGLLVSEVGMVRRKKSDVISPLPPIHENIVSVELGREDRQRYDYAQEEFVHYTIEKVAQIAREEGISVQQAVQVAVKKVLAAESLTRMSELRSLTSRGKGQAAVEWIDKFLSDDPERKLIVFTHYRDVRAFILNHPDVQKYDPVTILPGGEQKDASIQKDKKRFQEDPTCRLIVCSMAAREGHTLTAASDILMVDLPFVPSWVVQIAGRCWARMSELHDPHEATLHYMIADQTIDAKVLQSVRAKKKIFDAVIDNEGVEELVHEEEAPDSLVASVVEGFVTLGIAK